VVGFALSSVANIFIFVILYDFRLLPAQFCNKITPLWNFESHMQIAGQCAPWKRANSADHLVLPALQFQKIRVCRKFPGGAGISHYGTNKCFVDG
jgi:hypothetical protein